MIIKWASPGSPNKLLAAACLFVMAASASYGQEGSAGARGKRPSEWTLEERLAARLDRGRAAARGASGGQAIHDYALDGSRDPELLLPHELFQSLLTGFVPDPARRERQRAAQRPRLAAVHLNEELFWATLHTAAAPYLDTYLYPSPEATGAETAKQSATPCRAAFAALNRARDAFGRDVFDRFLYEAVAPVTQVTVATSASDPAAELRSTASGCPK
jgi:hypothetical protein